MFSSWKIEIIGIFKLKSSWNTLARTSSTWGSKVNNSTTRSNVLEKMAIFCPLNPITCHSTWIFNLKINSPLHLEFNLKIHLCWNFQWNVWFVSSRLCIQDYLLCLANIISPTWSLASKNISTWKFNMKNLNFQSWTWIFQLEEIDATLTSNIPISNKIFSTWNFKLIFKLKVSYLLIKWFNDSDHVT